MSMKDTLIFMLSRPEARYVVVPIITLLFANLAKYFCQKDSVIRRESFYWGPNIIMSAVLITFVDFSNRILYEDDKLSFAIHVVTALALCFLVLVGMILFVRLFGWEENPRDKMDYRITKICGIIIPNIVGFVTLYIILNLM